jgi:hypothetical protein
VKLKEQLKFFSFFLKILGMKSYRGISRKTRRSYPQYAGTAGMLLHVNGKFTMGKLKSYLFTKGSYWLSSSHHFERFTVATMT